MIVLIHVQGKNLQTKVFIVTVQDVENVDGTVESLSEESSGDFRNKLLEITSCPIEGVYKPSSYSLYQREGKIGEYFFYLREEEGTANLKVAIKRHDVHLSPDWSARIDLPNESRDYVDIFVELASNLKPSEKLYYLPVQPRWDEKNECFSEYGQGEFMLGPWYPSGVHYDEEGVEHFFTLGCTSCRGRNFEEAFANFKRFEESSYLSEMGFSLESQRYHHDREVEAVVVAMNSWPGPLEWVEPTPNTLPSFLANDEGGCGGE